MTLAKQLIRDNAHFIKIHRITNSKLSFLTLQSENLPPFPYYIWVHPPIHLAIQKRIKSIRNKNLLVWVVQYPKLGLKLTLIEQVRQHRQADSHLSSLRYTEAILQLELVGVTSNRYHVSTSKGHNLTVIWSKNLQIIFKAYNIFFSLNKRFLKSLYIYELKSDNITVYLFLNYARF